MEQPLNANPNPGPVYPQQQTIIMMGQSKKSPALAFILSFFFGPLGLLYASVSGGIIMLLIDIPVFFLTFGFGLIFTNLICVVWAMIAVSNHNKKSVAPPQVHIQHTSQYGVPPQPTSPGAGGPTVG